MHSLLLCIHKVFWEEVVAHIFLILFNLTLFYEISLPKHNTESIEGAINAPGHRIYHTAWALRLESDVCFTCAAMIDLSCAS